MEGADLGAAAEETRADKGSIEGSRSATGALKGPSTLRQKTRHLYTVSRWRYAAWTGTALCCCCVLPLLLFFAIGVPVLLHEKPWIGDAPGFIDCDNATTPFICVDALVKLMADGNVTLLDTRPPPTQFTYQPGLSRTIPGAQRAQWDEFTTNNEIMEPDAMAAVFRDKGVRNERPVVVFGGWNDDDFWGEEGRVWWQLYWLDHPNVQILHGGIWSWDDDMHSGSAVEDGPGDFVPRPVASRIVRLDDLVQTIKTDPESVFIVDARRDDEFNGAAPFGSDYGGRVPGSKQFWWRSAFVGDELRPRDEIRAELLALGFKDGMSLVTYCTRGVRSGFLTAIFTWAGFDVGNYAGSWKDWSEHISEEETRELLSQS